MASFRLSRKLYAVLQPQQQQVPTQDQQQEQVPVQQQQGGGLTTDHKVALATTFAPMLLPSVMQGMQNKTVRNTALAAGAAGLAGWAANKGYLGSRAQGFMQNKIGTVKNFLNRPNQIQQR